MTDSTNASVDVPSFSSGEKDALVVVASKLDEDANSRVALRITDVNGVVTDCDPNVPGEPSLALADAPESQSSSGSASQGCSFGPSRGATALPSMLGVLIGLSLIRRRRARR